jgi:PAP2 superfamily
LHLGRTPDVWLRSVLGAPALTSAIDLGYHSLWMYLLVGFMLAQSLRAPGPGRRQALLCFVLMWILLGTVAATVFASAGPIFYGLVAGTGAADPYAPLMAYLHRVDGTAGPLLALRIQEFLWTGYLHGGRPFGTGISAFPSLHIASTVWFALCAGQRSRRFGAVMWGLVLFMLVASVHLGWHYALDGYAAVLGTLGLWAACGWWVRQGSGPEQVAPGRLGQVVGQRAPR